jgi:hypothetical protein
MYPPKVFAAFTFTHWQVKAVQFRDPVSFRSTSEAHLTRAHTVPVKGPDPGEYHE